jgi:hypothetical protein
MDSRLVQGFYKTAHNRANDSLHRIWNMSVSLGALNLYQIATELHLALPWSLRTNSSSSRDRPRHRYGLLLLLAQDDGFEYVYRFTCPLLTNSCFKYNNTIEYNTADKSTTAK